MHNLFISFYRPTAKRWKIVVEDKAFPTDWYAVNSHAAVHSEVLSPEQIKNSVIALKPRKGEGLLRTEDILDTIEKNGSEIALVWIGAIQYYSGQLFDLKTIGQKAHQVGATYGLDLAHAIGNVPVKLNEWDVDFAVWCTYK